MKCNLSKTIQESKHNLQWHKVKLNEIARVVCGGTPKTSIPEYWNGNIAWLTPNDLTNYNKTYIENGERFITKKGLENSSATILPKEAILLSTRAPIGYVAIAKNNICTNQGFKSLILDSKQANNLFIFYWLKNNVQYLQAIGTGTTFGEISKNDVENLTIYLPPLETQQKIVNVLNSIDNKIENNHKIIAKLEEMAKTLYNYWFLQFDFPNDEGKPYATSKGEMKYSDELKQNIPKSFEILQIKDLCSIDSGFPFSSSDYVNSGAFRLITIKNVQDSYIDLEVDNYLNVIPKKIPSYCLLKPKDILMSLTGNVGRVGLMYSDNCLLNQRVALITPYNEAMRSIFYFTFKSELVKNKMKNLAVGTSQANLSPIKTGEIYIAYNQEIFEKYSNIINPYIEMMIQKLQENQKLAELRDYLLPMLMNGQVKVK